AHRQRAIDLHARARRTRLRTVALLAKAQQLMEQSRRLVQTSPASRQAGTPTHLRRGRRVAAVTLDRQLSWCLIAMLAILTGRYVRAPNPRRFTASPPRADVMVTVDRDAGNVLACQRIVKPGAPVPPTLGETSRPAHSPLVSLLPVLAPF